MLAEMPVAFAGTVTEMSDTTVTVEVDPLVSAASTGETDLVDVTLPEENTSAASRRCRLRHRAALPRSPPPTAPSTVAGSADRRPPSSSRRFRLGVPR
ncbi:MAG: hypothetical protein WKF58_02830 [Ilumatobacteraceae bacterium]